MYPMQTSYRLDQDNNNQITALPTLGGNSQIFAAKTVRIGWFLVT